MNTFLPRPLFAGGYIPESTDSVTTLSRSPAFPAFLKPSSPFEKSTLVIRLKRLAASPSSSWNPSSHMVPFMSTARTTILVFTGVLPDGILNTSCILFQPRLPLIFSVWRAISVWSSFCACSQKDGFSPSPVTAALP